MKTAVEKLISEIKGYPSDCEIFQEALEAEKQQHYKTWLDSTCQFDNSVEMTYKKSFEDYYRETYGSKGSDETNGNNVEEVPNIVEDVFNQELFNYFSQEFKINLLNTEMHDIIDIVKNITSSQTEISDEEITIGRFMNWFIKHYSTATIDGFFGYVNAMGQEVRIQDILKEYKKLNGIENN